MRKQVANTIRGKPKSGRIWKNEREPFGSMIKDKPLKSTWLRKMKLKEDRKCVLKLQSDISQSKELESSLKRERRKEKLKLKQENEHKGETVQVIRKTSKIKKMSKKQLKYIRKQDTN